jgi:hypothetical protein
LAPSLDWAAMPLRRKTSETGPMSTSSTLGRVGGRGRVRVRVWVRVGVRVRFRGRVRVRARARVR